MSGIRVLGAWLGNLIVAKVSQVDRREYHFEKEIKDPISGEAVRYFPKWKQVARQLVSIPFALVAFCVLGALTTLIFGVELLISHVYVGEYKDWIAS